jgi:hypothetical protein
VEVRAGARGVEIRGARGPPDGPPHRVRLDRHAAAAGLRRIETALAEGFIELDDAFVSKLEAKCSSAMRLIADDAHRAGLARVWQARDRGERWLSSYSVLVFERAVS